MSRPTAADRRSLHWRLLFWLCLSLATGQTGSLAADSGAGQDKNAVAAYVRQIQAELRRIDAANDRDAPGDRHLSANLPHWEFSGLFEGSYPSYLYARFSEGSRIREESYYLAAGKLLLMRVEKYWDVDDESQAAEPAIRDDYYVRDGRAVAHGVKIGHAASRIKAIDPSQSTLPVERTELIARILMGNPPSKDIARSLETLPLTDR